MKQIALIKVEMKDDKSRSKALKTVFGLSGVESAALRGTEKDQLEVVGEGVDSVVLTRLLRKNVGYADLISVGPVPEKKPNPPPPAVAQSTPGDLPAYPYPVSYQPWIYEVRNSEPTCSIM